MSIQALWAAFEADDAAAFEAALKACPSPNKVLVNCDNPLPCQAARLGRRAILEAALRADSWGITAADQELRTPLHHAALAGDLKAIQIGMRQKPERVRPEMLVRQQDAAKMTVLHSAVLSGNEELVCFLLEVGNGAGVDVQNKVGLFPVHLACSKGMSAAVAVMCQLEGCEAAKQSADPGGGTLLHRATKEGHSEAIKVLLQSGFCDPNVQDSDGSTALHLAYAMGLSDIVGELLPVTDQDILDGQGKRAMDWNVPDDVSALEQPLMPCTLAQVTISVSAFGVANVVIYVSQQEGSHQQDQH